MNKKPKTELSQILSDSGKRLETAAFNAIRITLAFYFIAYIISIY